MYKTFFRISSLELGNGSMYSWPMMHRLWHICYVYIIRAVFKWFMHVLTGRSELERWLNVVDRSKYRAVGVRGIENSFFYSRHAVLRQITTSLSVRHIEEGIRFIISIKMVRPTIIRPLRVVLQQIVGYHHLCHLVESHRSVVYDSQNREHESKLMKLWSLLTSSHLAPSPYARVSHDWQRLGFQGSDPATDFRGMGVLGLDQLLYLVEFDDETAKSLFGLSAHPKLGFPFAIAGITMTALVRELLINGLLKNHLYNTVLDIPQLVDFHRIYCRVFSLFCSAWKQADPSSIMEFNIIKELFRQNITVYLQRYDAKLDSYCSLSILHIE